MKRVLAFGTLTAAAICGAQTYTVVPNIYANAEAGTQLNSLIRNAGNPRTQQLIVGASELTALVGMNLTGITYRLGTFASNATYPTQSITWSDYTIQIGPSLSPAASTGTFASNFTSAPTTVRTGALTMGAGSWQYLGGAGPQPWGAEIGFQTPYLYNGGDIALYITHPGSSDTATAGFLDAAVTTAPGYGTTYRAWGNSAHNGTSGTQQTFTVVRLTGSPVPEPATLAVLGLGTLALFRRRRRA